MKTILESQVEQLKDCLEGENIRIVSSDDELLLNGSIQIEELKINYADSSPVDLYLAQSELTKQIEEKYPNFLIIS